MALRLKKLFKKNPSDPSAPGKWHFVQSKTSTIGLEELTRDIERNSSLSRGDIQSVLINMSDLIPRYLKLGITIRLPGFGSFRPSVTSHGQETAEALTTRHIKEVRIVYRPSVELKQEMRDATFRVVG